MLTEEWRGTSVLYVSPLRALLNNLEIRIREYCTMVGRGEWRCGMGTSVIRRDRGSWQNRQIAS
jgi:ATP-dependent helicase Lhr and Lhr-like helicase